MSTRVQQARATFGHQGSWVAVEPHGALVVVRYFAHAGLVVTLQPQTEPGHFTVLSLGQVQAGPWSEQKPNTENFHSSH